MVTLLGVLGALVVLFGAAVVATRQTGAVLQPAERDRFDPGLPEGALVADDLHRVRFGLAVRGYRMAEVDAAMDRAADALAEAHARLRALEGQTPSQRPLDVPSDREGAERTSGEPAVSLTKTDS